MALNWKRERFDDFIVLFNNQSLSMSKDSSNDILSFKFSPDEECRTINLNPAMKINLSDKRDPSLCNREIKMTVRVHVFVEVKSLGQMYKRFPEMVFEYPRESGAMFFLGKTPVRFLIMVILKESLTGSFENSKSRTIMPPKYPLLPDGIKTLNSGISTWLSLWDKYQMCSHEQMETDKLRYAIRVSPSPCSRHLIIHLRYLWNPHKSPCLNQMSTKRDSLFIGELTRENSMSSHINSVEGIESGNPFWTSEVSGSHEVCLMKVSHLLCSKARIRLAVVISLDLNPTGLSVTKENSGNSGDRWKIANLSLHKLPMDDFCSNTREGRTTSPVSFKFCSDGKDLFNHMLRGFSPYSFWSTTLVFETSWPALFESFEPFGEPTFTPLNQLKYLIETISCFVKLYCFATFFIFILSLHRLSLLPKVFGRSLGDLKISSRCYDIFGVHDVMI